MPVPLKKKVAGLYLLGRSFVVAAGPRATSEPMALSMLANLEDFFIFVFKKIKISKIYGGFEKFQDYTPVAQAAPCLGDRGHVALWLGDRT